MKTTNEKIASAITSFIENVENVNYVKNSLKTMFTETMAFEYPEVSKRDERQLLIFHFNELYALLDSLTSND